PGVLLEVSGREGDDGAAEGPAIGQRRFPDDQGGVRVGAGRQEVGPRAVEGVGAGAVLQAAGRHHLGAQLGQLQPGHLVHLTRAHKVARQGDRPTQHPLGLGVHQDISEGETCR
ncbi:hypothetical protein chiPu_0029555, partial [Chiloscyllium punctatum]|nr:hypothetical protein [Chiloscyllium punctatum]